MKIYYTLDGTKPSTQSFLYKEPILIENKSGSNMQYAIADGIDYINSYRPSRITMGTVVRAIAVDSSGKCSEVRTQTYFVEISRLSDLKDIPVLSITTSPENLFDYFTGIYVSGVTYEDALARGEDQAASANYLNDWEKEVYVEYFEPQKDKTYEGKMLLHIIKDISVTLPQKSFLLTASEGAFRGSGLANYYNNVSKSLMVQTNQWDNTYKIRDYLAGKLLTKTSAGTRDLTPCVVFVNGEYWGGYMLVSEYDEAYIKKHYNVEDAEVIIAKDGIVSKEKYQQEFDELYSYVLNHDLQREKNYAWLTAHMDVSNYLEYFCANMFLANVEYGQEPLVMWRTITEDGEGYQDGRWRFLMPSTDLAMDNGIVGKVGTSSMNTFLQSSVTGDLFLQSLLKNKEFLKQLDTTMRDMAENVFTVKRVDSILSDLSAQMRKMVEVSYKRFTGNLGDSYEMEVEKICTFFKERETYIMRYMKDVLEGGGK
jgi:hypothetical protein